MSARRGRLFESSSDGWLNDKDVEDGEDEEEEEEEGGEERHENEQTARRTRGLKFERTRAKRPVRRERASKQAAARSNNIGSHQCLATESKTPVSQTASQPGRKPASQLGNQQDS